MFYEKSTKDIIKICAWKFIKNEVLMSKTNLFCYSWIILTHKMSNIKR